MAEEFIRIEVDSRALRRAVKAVEGDIGDMREANAQAAEIVAHAAKGIVAHRSGDLAGGIKGNRAISKAVVSDNIRYANAIHWGVGPRRGRRGPHNIRGSQFIYRAAEATQDQWHAVILNGVNKAIKKEGLG